MASDVLFYGEGERLRQRLLAKEPALPFSFWVCRFRDSPALFPDPQVALVVKNPLANAGRLRHKFDPWVRESPWRRAWQPTPAFLPGASHGQRSLAGYSLWGHKESDMTGRLSTAQHAGEGRTRRRKPSKLQRRGGSLSGVSSDLIVFFF